MIFKRKNGGTGNGFTLIELLVVIAIIGVLASVVLASLNTARTKSRDARRIADIKQIQLALELYFDSGSAYPANGSLYTDDVLKPTYIPTVPIDPLGGATPNYKYCLITDTSYHLAATLEEGTNPAFDSDRDLNTSTCADGDLIDGTNDATNKVYDVTN